jgi:hypothetical protein
MSIFIIVLCHFWLSTLEAEEPPMNLPMPSLEETL